MGDNGYALDLLSPVRHVATELDRAAGAALSVAEMAATYTHPNPGDLARVRLHEGCASDDAAVRWLIDRAIAALGKQVTSDDNHGYVLTRPFDKLRYDRKKLYRTTDENAEDEQRALRAVYNDLAVDRSFYVVVQRGGGKAKEARLRLHPLARAIPQIPEKQFLELAADIKRNGVEVPIVLYDGQVLDGRHRTAVASALRLPVRVTEVSGDEARARARIVSLNINRRMLTSAQRASIVRQLFLPEAKEQAKERLEKGRQTGGGDRKSEEYRSSAELRSSGRGAESIKAAEIAVRESGSLATVRSVEAIAPLDHAPKTQARVDKGEIKTVADARREALKEQGRDPAERPPVLRPATAWDRLGRAAGEVRSARESVEAGRVSGRDVTEEEWNGRLDEIITNATWLRR